MITIRSSLLIVVGLVGCIATRLDAQATARACLSITPLSTSLREDFASMASDQSAAGDTARALYHLPVAAPQKVEQVLTESLCTKAIVSIRLWRGDGQGPQRVFLFRVGNVFVATGESNTAFSGAVWTFDQSLTRILGGVLQ